MAVADAQRRRRRLSVEAREREIVEGALHFFARHGLAADTRALAEALDVSHGLIFRYFPTKAALLDRVFEHVVLADRHPAWEVLLRDRSRSYRDRLIAFYESFLAQTDKPEWLRLIMFSSLNGDDVARRYYEEHFKALVDIMALELRRERGDLRSRRAVTPDERETIFLLHGSVYYYLIRRHIVRTAPAPRTADWLPRMVDTFLAGATGSVGA